MSNDDRGAISTALVGVICAVVILGVVLAGAGQLLAARFRAATAADAAALAAAPATFSGDPYAEAVRFATANRAQLVSCECRRDRSSAPRIVDTLTEVTVDVVGLGIRRIRARGRAEFVPEVPP